MDTKQYTHRQLQMPGPAGIFAYDDVNDYYLSLGMIDNIRTRRETDKIFQSEYHKSRNARIDGLAVGERWFCNGDIMERLNPDLQRLVFKNCGTPAITTGCTLLSITEKMRLFRGEAKVLTHNSGFLSDVSLPAPTAPTIAVAGVGGSFVAGTYVVVIEAVYTDNQGLNPVRSEYINTAGQVVIATDEVTVTWTAPLTAQPAYYNLYEYDTALGQTRADADLIAQVNGNSPTNVTFLTFLDLGDWPGTVTGFAFEITDQEGVVTYSAGVDYNLDTTCARLSLVDAGTIDDGELVLVTYVYRANPWYEQSIGPGSINPRILHVVIKWFKDDERDPPTGRGAEIHFPHVLAESGFEWLFDQMDFESGWSQEWEVLLDTASGNYGTIYTFHKVMDTWDLIELSALSDYSSDDACPLGSS